ncbi:hypothetical protein D3C80_1215310 [compost metagenome]
MAAAQGDQYRLVPTPVEQAGGLNDKIVAAVDRLNIQIDIVQFGLHYAGTDRSHAAHGLIEIDGEAVFDRPQHFAGFRIGNTR